LFKNQKKIPRKKALKIQKKIFKKIIIACHRAKKNRKNKKGHTQKANGKIFKGKEIFSIIHN